MMGCVRAWGAPDGSPRQTRIESRGVFVYSKLRASSTKKLAKTLKCSIPRKGAQHNGYITYEEMAFTKNNAVLQVDDISL